MEQELKEERKRAGLQEISERVFRKRYAYSSTETWSECAARVGGFVAKAERDPEIEMKWKEEFSLAIEKLDFLPGGRTLRNASRPHSQMLNCFVLDVEDNIEDIGMLCHDVLVVASGGGGIGVNFSKLRPMGASLRRKGGEASGPCSYMQMIDRIGDTVETGGQRRIALIFILNVNHPEIRDFIHLKEKEGVISNANISVGVTEEFLEAVRLDNDWELTHAGKVYETVRARDLWKEIIHANHNWGDPGIFNISLANKYSNIYYRDDLVSPNPCVSGDTLVAVADGREAVPIEDLAEEGNDVPVYTMDDKGKIAIRMMRNPRVTGRDKDVYRVTFDDGSYIDVTENHKLRLRSGDYRRVDELRDGDSLLILNREKHPLIPNKPKFTYNHLRFGGDGGYGRLEHRLVAGHSYGGPIPRGYVVHHADFDRYNNAPENLQIVTREEHNEIHSIAKLGLKNPFHTTFTNEQKRAFLAAAGKPGEKNPRYSGFTDDDLMDAAISLCRSLGRRASVTEWVNLAGEKGWPKSFSGFRRKRFGSVKRMLIHAAREVGVPVLEFYTDLREYRTFEELQKTTDLDLVWDGSVVRVRKVCEGCGCDFEVPYNKREQSFHTRACSLRYNESISNKRRDAVAAAYAARVPEKREQQLGVFVDLRFELDRTPLKKEFEERCKEEQVSSRIGTAPFHTYAALKEAAVSYNHRVVSVERIGKETVYNGTVDDFHNFFIAGPSSDGNVPNSFLNNLQCGEIPMAPYDCCCLGSVNLANMITPPVMQDGDILQWGQVDWDKLEKTVSMGVRFLDNVLSTNDYPLARIKETCDQNRRIGLGVMGLHYMLLDLGIEYGDNDRCLKFLDELFRRIKESAYEASADLAAEKKSFPRFHKELVMKSQFIQQLPEWLQDKIERQGLRNCALLTIAPTGSTAQLPQVSTGLEPIFQYAYTRRARLGDGDEEHEDFVVIDPKFRQFSDADFPMEHFSTALDLSVRDHLLVQAAAQRHIDNGISKTCNIPNDYPVEEMEKDMLYFASRIKGSTMWRDGARDMAILKPLDIDEAKRLLGEGNHIVEVHEHDCGVACEI